MAENTLFQNETASGVKKILPLIPLRNVVMFPSVDTSLFFGRKESSRALLHAYDNTTKMVIIVAQKSSNIDKPGLDDIFQLGVLSRIEHILQTDGNMHAIVHGIARVKITSLLQTDPFMLVEYIEEEAQKEDAIVIQESANTLMTHLKKAFSMGRQMDLPAMMQLQTGVSSSDLADQVIFALEGKIEEKQALLEEQFISKRLEGAANLLFREMKVAELEKEIESKTNEKFNVSMKRNVLEERKRQIEKELKKMGKTGDDSELGDLEKQIKKAAFPKDVRKKVEKELSRLLEMGSNAPESAYIRNWLETMVELPWGTYTKDSLDLDKAKKILEADHYGLKDVKDRILEHLAVLNLKEKQKAEKRHGANILWFIGPPGVGKTSLGKSIAKAMNRQFVRISLGGIRDEAEIRGHRRTYVGAMPGRIIKGLKDAKSLNPVFMFDEVDKMTTDFRGDPSAALLEVLDPEQNKEFTDHYVDVHTDLSKVFFILTGNDISGLPIALRDRVEVIDFSGYTQDEKFHIAKQYLVSKQMEINGLDKKQVGAIDDATIRFIIDKYTREAGVRNLERVFARLFRKVAKNTVSKGNKLNLNDTKQIQEMLGPERYTSMIKGKQDEIGVATGMFWSSVGGDILFVEVNTMKGKGQMILTGKLGSVMKESCQIALSYIRSQAAKYGLETDFHKTDIHVHFPEGAVPKDGPSAGIAITTALISALTGKKVARDVAMTGEITIRGNVLPIGGLKEKTTGAHRAGIQTIIIPKGNEKDMVDIPDQVKKDIKFHFAETYDQVYALMFGKKA